MTPDRLGFALKYEGPPMSDPKADKLAFLKGQPEVVMYFDKKAHVTSSYKDNLKGLQVPEDRRASILHKHQSSFVQHTIPDPTTMGRFFPSILASNTLYFD